MGPFSMRIFLFLVVLATGVDSQHNGDSTQTVASGRRVPTELLPESIPQDTCRVEVDADREIIVYDPTVTITPVKFSAASVENKACCNDSTIQGIVFSELEKLAEAYVKDEEDTKRQLQQLYKTIADLAGILSEDVSTLPKDCSEALAMGMTSSGVYTMQLQETGREIQVFCDMDTDGGGWTVFQRRLNGTVDFYRDSESYRLGFGHPESEFWLGNENLYRLVSQNDYQLRVDLTDFEGNSAYALYDSFGIGDVYDDYRLTVGGYSGTAGDSLSSHNNKRFSTWDRDNDNWIGNCAKQFGGAWWYAGCYKSNLNGRYFGDPYEGVAWYTWKGNYDPLKTSEMKFRVKQVI